MGSTYACTHAAAPLAPPCHSLLCHHHHRAPQCVAGPCKGGVDYLCDAFPLPSLPALSNIAQQVYCGSSASASRGKTSAICYDFVKGVCQRGNDCRYSHDLSLIARTARGGGAPSLRSGEVCYDYLRGRCSRGSSCKYSHNISFLAAPGFLTTALSPTNSGLLPPDSSEAATAASAPTEPAAGACSADLSTTAGSSAPPPLPSSRSGRRTADQANSCPTNGLAPLSLASLADASSFPAGPRGLTHSLSADQNTNAAYSQLHAEPPPQQQQGGGGALWLSGQGISSQEAVQHLLAQHAAASQNAYQLQQLVQAAQQQQQPSLSVTPGSGPGGGVLSAASASSVGSGYHPKANSYPKNDLLSAPYPDQGQGQGGLSAAQAASLQHSYHAIMRAQSMPVPGQRQALQQQQAGPHAPAPDSLTAILNNLRSDNPALLAETLTGLAVAAQAHAQARARMMAGSYPSSAPQPIPGRGHDGGPSPSLSYADDYNSHMAGGGSSECNGMLGSSGAPGLLSRDMAALSMGGPRGAPCSAPCHPNHTLHAPPRITPDLLHQLKEIWNK